MGSQGSRGAAVDGIAGAIGEIVDARFSELLSCIRSQQSVPKSLAASATWRPTVLWQRDLRIGPIWGAWEGGQHVLTPREFLGVNT